jgi:hypothetical protein
VDTITARCCIWYAQGYRDVADVWRQPLLLMGPLQWSAIFYAVDAGNWNTFMKLLPYYGGIAKDIVDERGWSLLHLAAARGHRYTIRHLLQLGANPCLRTSPTRAYILNALFDKRCTPEDVAEAHGQRQLEVFISVAQELEIDLDFDEYWDAQESFEND